MLRSWRWKQQTDVDLRGLNAKAAVGQHALRMADSGPIGLCHISHLVEENAIVERRRQKYYILHQGL